MKKLVSILIVAALTIAMAVPVAAGCGSPVTACKAEEAKAEVKSSGNTEGNQVSSDGQVICYVSTGTPQGINNAYLENMASNTMIGGVATAPIDANESKALYDYAAATLGNKCYLITAFKGVGTGLVRIENPNFKAGTNVTVFVKTATGIIAVPAIITDGALSVNIPAGALSVAVYYNAVAPW